jgi:hypothetical protein
MLCHEFSISSLLCSLDNLSLEAMHILVVPILNLIISLLFFYFTLCYLLLNNLGIRFFFHFNQTSLLIFLLHLQPKGSIIALFLIHLPLSLISIRL